jgi:ubiquinone/menaquinone biosynthesis C-methylase UbiE
VEQVLLTSPVVPVLVTPETSSVPAAPRRETQRRVVDYYDQCGDDYRILWRSDETHCLHYGFFDEERMSTPRHWTERSWGQAIGLGVRAVGALAGLLAYPGPPRMREWATHCLRVAAQGRSARHEAGQTRMNAVCADAARIRSGDRVLDAGCGLGGSDVFLNKHCGASMFAINVQPRHLAQARAFATASATNPLVRFSRQDYTQMAFAPESFDVVWGLESICHCQDKSEFLAEAYRVLRKPGRLMVADFFQLKEHLSPAETSQMQWIDGWAIPNLALVRQFGEDLAAAGFTNVSYRDIRPHVMPSSERMYKASLVAGGIGRAMERLHMRSAVQTRNIRAARDQYATLRDAVWTYGIFTAAKG